jgi:hypothetical protein
MQTAKIQFENLEDDSQTAGRVDGGAWVPKLNLPSIGLGKIDVGKRSENPFVIPLNSERMLMHREFERLSEVRSIQNAHDEMNLALK